ncbi:hypothetical protein CI762_15620 [Klebsiella pneumoniae subsp. pneumoniae]|nr:hypothetical protein CI762_15620 [Klebsiella pneumoniae subsp. pneumoniae]
MRDLILQLSKSSIYSTKPIFQRISKLDKSDYHSNPNERLLIKCCGDQWHSKRPVDEKYPSLTAIKLVD